MKTNNLSLFLVAFRQLASHYIGGAGRGRALQTFGLVYNIFNNNFRLFFFKKSFFVSSFKDKIPLEKSNKKK